MRQYKLDKKAHFTEIKCIKAKLKKSENATELKKSTSTLQRYRREINMLLPYRIQPSTNTTQTSKQKSSIHTEHDLKMTSKGPQKTQMKMINLFPKKVKTKIC